MKLHLPVLLRKSVLACFFSTFAYSMSSGIAAAADFTLGSEDSLTIDYAAADSIRDLENGTLRLKGDTILFLSNCGNGDGKTYTLFTGVSGLVDAEGNAITLDSTNNAIANYFDATLPGTGFWAGATLMLNNGTLRLVRHSEAVKAAETISTRRTGSVDYQYYEGVHFADIEYTAGSSYAYGGAIYGDSSSTITLSDNGSVTFSGNTASASSSDYSAYGGAIYGDENSSISLDNNGSVTFSGNTASSPSSYAYGGAIYGWGDSAITLSNNGSVTFSRNSAYDGGAIAGSVSMTGNESVTFSGNTTKNYGGAIYSGSVSLDNNGSVTFSGNTAYNGGAIYTWGGNLSIQNNGTVLFEKNVEDSGSVYRLRSIYAGDYGDVISLSAAAGKSIEFRDSVYIGVDYTFNLNEDYTDASGVVYKQQGDIIFSGKYTETHLDEILAADEKGRTATAEEIRLSRTTEVNALTNLYGGRLRVEDGAVYQGQGITAHEASEATVRVKDATLSHAGYNLEFNAGTALEVAGNSTIRGNVNLKEGSLFKLEKAASLSLYETLEADAATLTVNGGALLEGGATLNASLTLADGATLDMDALDVGAVTLNGALTFGGQVTMGDKLHGILSEMSGWEESVILFTGLTDLVLPAVVADDAADRLWLGDVFSNLAGNENYYFNYVSEVGSLAVVHVPEPTTATLSLLALAALAARRRRK